MDRFRVAHSTAGLTFLILAVWWVTSAYPAKDESKTPGISPERVAGFVHAVLQAHRTIYTTHIVNRLQQKGIVMAVEHWEQENALPLPAQLLRTIGGRKRARDPLPSHRSLTDLPAQRAGNRIRAEGAGNAEPRPGSPDYGDGEQRTQTIFSGDLSRPCRLLRLHHLP